jgi:hypothetical protein
MNAHRTLIISSLALTLSAPAVAKDNPGDAARKQAALMFNALVRGDLEAVVTYTHPKAVTLMGGKQKFMSMMEKMMSALRARDLRLRSATVSAPQQLVEAGPGRVQVIIPTELVLRSPTTSLHQPGFLLGLSADGGKAWKFIDTSLADADALRKAFPECSRQLKIPSRPKPYESPE